MNWDAVSCATRYRVAYRLHPSGELQYPDDSFINSIIIPTNTDSSYSTDLLCGTLGKINSCYDPNKGSYCKDNNPEYSNIPGSCFGCG